MTVIVAVAVTVSVSVAVVGRVVTIALMGVAVVVPRGDTVSVVVVVGALATIVIAATDGKGDLS